MYPLLANELGRLPGQFLLEIPEKRAQKLR